MQNNSAAVIDDDVDRRRGRARCVVDSKGMRTSRSMIKFSNRLDLDSMSPIKDEILAEGGQKDSAAVSPRDSKRNE